MGRVLQCLTLGVLLLFLPPLPMLDQVNGDRFKPGASPKARVVAEDERQLQKDVQARDVAAVTAFFRNRTPSVDEVARLRRTIRQMGDESFAARDRAQAEVLAAGRASMGLLRQSRYDPDAEVAARSRRCLEVLETEVVPDLIPQAVRLVAEAKPDDGLATLLGYFPFAEDEESSRAIVEAVAALGVAAGKPDALVEKALADAEPLRRACAALALLKSGVAEGQQAAKRMLTDPEPEVRLRLALALLEGRERLAVPALIDLLAEIPDERHDMLERLLMRMAGEHAPAAPRGTDTDSRRRCQQAWLGWWRDHADAVDLSKWTMSTPAPTTTLVLTMDLYRYNGAVTELTGGRGQRRVGGLEYPLSMQTLPDDRLLLSEYRAGLVTERDRHGEVVWRYEAPGQVVAAQRLASGNTFVALRSRLLEVNPRGEIVRDVGLGVRNVAGARRCRNGHTVVVTLHGSCQHLDGEGKEVRRFPVGLAVLGAGIDVLPTRRVLVPEFSANRVAEYDADGRLAWQAAVEKPTTVLRLADGHTLVGSTSTQQVVELDQAGKVVWQQQAPDAVTAIGRR